MPCNVTLVHWHTSGTDEDLRESTFSPGDAEIVWQLRSNSESVPCDQGTKQAPFRVRMTKEIHTRLNGVVLAFGYVDGSEDFQCVSFPPARYNVIDLTGE